MSQTILTGSLLALINLVAPDMVRHNRLIGDLTQLNTAQKASLTLALNSLKATIDARPAPSSVIDDTAASSVINKVWSPKQTSLAIDAALAALIGTSTQLAASLQALTNAIHGDETAAAALAVLVGHKVQFNTSQQLAATQQAQARANIQAVGEPEVVARLGAKSFDFAAAYTGAIASATAPAPAAPPAGSLLQSSGYYFNPNNGLVYDGAGNSLGSRRDLVDPAYGGYYAPYDPNSGRAWGR
jgi:hypothetical protein